MPKFKLEKNYNLVEALKSMGLTALFDENSNMTSISDQRLTINLVTPPLHPLHLSPGSAPSKAFLLPGLASQVRGTGSAPPVSVRC